MPASEAALAKRKVTQAAYRARPEVKKRNAQRIRLRLQADGELRQRRKETRSRWNARHPEEVRATSRRAQAGCRAIVDAAKAGQSCACGESDPICLDFHHRDPATKLDTVCRMVAKRRPKATILAEIAKCDLICANCHRKLHREGLRQTQ